MSTIIQILGWILAVIGGVALLLGSSDMENYAIVSTIGLFLLPIGVLLIASGLILKRLTIIESHARAHASEHAKPPSSADQ